MPRRTAKTIAVLLMATLARPLTALPADHMLAAASVTARLNAAAETRAADLRAIRAFLASPAARAAAGAIGADAVEMQSRALLLCDAEASDLARRATTLTVDPVAGSLSYNERLLLALGLLLVIAMSVMVWSFVTEPYGN